jgi:hydroxyacid-oxoacid transhydrogenase
MLHVACYAPEELSQEESMRSVAPTNSGIAAETVFTWTAPPLVIGRGAFDELGQHARAMGLRHVAVVTDAGIARTGLADRAVRSLDAAGISSALFADVHIEPTDDSIAAAAAWAREIQADGYIAVGGGSAIDTAKAMNLLATNPGDVSDYLNPPIGAGRAPEQPLAPLIAVPTTAGTGAESTPVCIVGMHELRVKTGISHPALRPRLAVVDPLTTASLPRGVTIAGGMDVLCHALESYTARPFDSRPATPAGSIRPAYNGANPISDVWAIKALDLLGRWFRRAVEAPDDLDAREGMMLAATFAGIGFGNAGVHIPHACAYPVAGLVRDYRPADYPAGTPLVPHGLAVVATAPAAFRFTYPSAPERHVEAARILAGRPDLGGPDALADAVTALCRDVGAPVGLAAYGYDESDIASIVEGALAQQRLLAVSPRPVTEADLTAIVRESIGTRSLNESALARPNR